MKNNRGCTQFSILGALVSHYLQRMDGNLFERLWTEIGGPLGRQSLKKFSEVLFNEN